MEVPPGPLGPPPDYEAALASGPAAPPTNPIGPRGADLEPPPDYCVAASLPSYEQAEQLKEKLLAGDVEDQREEPAPRRSRRNSPRDDWEGEEDITLLGNDFVFFTAFLTAFLFNWIGFLLLMCFCHTIAARYGALSGFGLSLAKWTLIVKNSTDLASADNSWLWWLITAFGMLVCMRAIFQYLHIKRTWGRLSTSARERLFFFY